CPGTRADRRPGTGDTGDRHAATGGRIREWTERDDPRRPRSSAPTIARGDWRPRST
ncbi:MAG: hypothetical protein AVDCRST_MAG33-3033, partial [uncultured Thermomicrobiales bacterium]